VLILGQTKAVSFINVVDKENLNIEHDWQVLTLHVYNFFEAFFSIENFQYSFMLNMSRFLHKCN
jgi:hypothetical protein